MYIPTQKEIEEMKMEEYKERRITQDARPPRLDADVTRIINDLLDGIHSWASEEDGVHPKLWDAYVKVCDLVNRSPAADLQ